MHEFKKIAPMLLIVIAIILLVSTFFKSSSSNIIGTWESEGDGYNSNVFEFYKNGTGVMYAVSGGKAWDHQTYSYVLSEGTLTLTWDVVRSYPCEVSGNTLMLDGKLFSRTGGGVIPWFRYVLAIACVGAFVVIKKELEHRKKRDFQG